MWGKMASCPTGRNLLSSIRPTVGITTDGSGFCGGVIISAEWMLTGAQCIKGQTSFEVVAGVHKVMDKSESSQVRPVIKGDRVTMPESYNASTLQNDLALLRLSLPRTVPSRALG